MKSDDFHLKSNKYSGKYDYGPKHVAVGWTLHDAADLIGDEMTLQMKKGIPNDVTGKWKMFNNFEKKDHKYNTKKRLEDEAN